MTFLTYQFTISHDYLPSYHRQDGPPGEHSSLIGRVVRAIMQKIVCKDLLSARIPNCYVSISADSYRPLMWI